MGKGHWDKLVISAKSFPVLYWDKFVKKRVRTKYSEQFEFDAISNTLGMEKSALASQSEEGGGIITLITSIDWRYQMWKVGITMTDNPFLYQLGYFVFSVMLLTIIVYIYTVVAFNFFRQFYVSGEDDEESKMCHDMLTVSNKKIEVKAILKYILLMVVLPT